MCFTHDQSVGNIPQMKGRMARLFLDRGKKKLPVSQKKESE